jgi:hypothetical protein
MAADAKDRITERAIEETSETLSAKARVHCRLATKWIRISIAVCALFLVAMLANSTPAIIALLVAHAACSFMVVWHGRLDRNLTCQSLQMWKDERRLKANAERSGTMARERATEQEYLKWFRIWADFGPAHDDVVDSLNTRFMDETGKDLPIGWNVSADGENNMDRD